MADTPSVKFRVGSMTASVWRNESENGHFYSVTLQRSYKDKDNDGEWKNSDSIGSGDLLNASKVLERAEHWISTK